MYASNNMRGGVIKVTDKNHLYHHPLHVKALRDKAKEAGINHQCYAKAIGIKYEGKNLSLIDFVIDNLKKWKAVLSTLNTAEKEIMLWKTLGRKLHRQL